jgi:hypothetical protein
MPSPLMPPFQGKYGRICAELIAIEQWDRIYQREHQHNGIEIAAYRHRQIRRKELFADLLSGKMLRPRPYLVE